MEVTKVMDELQRLLSGSAIGLEHSRHEDGAVGVALAELLLSKWYHGIPLISRRKLFKPTRLASFVMFGNVILRLLHLLVVISAKTCKSLVPQVTDAWCDENCNADPPNCLASLCTCKRVVPSPSTPTPSPRVPTLPPSPAPPTPAPKWISEALFAIVDSNSPVLTVLQQVMANIDINNHTQLVVRHASILPNVSFQVCGRQSTAGIRPLLANSTSSFQEQRSRTSTKWQHSSGTPTSRAYRYSRLHRRSTQTTASARSRATATSATTTRPRASSCRFVRLSAS